jgi:CRISPR type III-A-associated RAMP protein Csm4
MQPAFVVRFFPSGPWRIGPDSGARDRVESILHSDALYSAVCVAMARLGFLEEWLAATFGNPEGPAVRFSSCYPFQNEVLFVVPPSSLWPPAPSLRVRWKGARFVPAPVVEDLLVEKPLDEERWRVDGLSQCLVPADWDHGPFRTAIRSSGVVDRLSGNVAAYRTACLEFSPGSGMWAVGAYADQQKQERWAGPVQAALRLLSDSGLGGERSRGWGRSVEPEFREGVLPDVILPGNVRAGAEPDAEAPPVPETAYWLLSLFTPAAGDSVDWGRGNYSLVTRGGRIESPAARGELKKLSRMVAEGSVIFSGAPLAGAGYDVAPEGFPHPVYRAGFALALPIPWREAAR